MNKLNTKQIIGKLTDDINGREVMRLSQIDPFADMDCWTPSGSAILDFKLGTLGFPTGIIEFRGKSKGGKTTAALHAIKEHQDKHKDQSVTIIQSFEQRDNKHYAAKIGIDPESVIVIKARFVEDMFSKTDYILNEFYERWEKAGGAQNDLKILIVMDSLGSALSRSEHEVAKENLEQYRKALATGKETKKVSNSPAAFARAAKQGIKYFLAEIYQKKICYIIINHTYANIGSPVGGKKSFGGDWIEYLPCLRLDFQQIEWIRENDDEVGQISRVKVEKNDYGVRRKIQLNILLGYGYVLTDEEIELATEYGLLEGVQKKSFMNGKLVWKSRKELHQHYREGNKWLKFLQKRLTKLLHQKVLESKKDLPNTEE